jgi:tripartite-type tricarboxylate transporter receptor subunit TctC
VLSRVAQAQAYPVRPVKIIVSFAAGGPTDILARLTAQWLSERLGQQFVVENRPSSGGNIGAEAAVRSAPDGYTLLMIDATPTETRHFMTSSISMLHAISLLSRLWPSNPR